MTKEELQIWQTLSGSSDPMIRDKAYNRLAALQKSLAGEGYYDGTWKKNQLADLKHSEEVNKK